MNSKKIFIPTLNSIKEKGKVYKIIKAVNEKGSPFVFIEEDGKLEKYLLPDWYFNWVRDSNFLMPCLVEFGYFSYNGKWFAEMLYSPSELLLLSELLKR